MKFVVWENGRNPAKTYQTRFHPPLKRTWSDQDANSEPQLWETSDFPLESRDTPVFPILIYFMSFAVITVFKHFFTLIQMFNVVAYFHGNSDRFIINLSSTCIFKYFVTFLVFSWQERECCLHLSTSIQDNSRVLYLLHRYDALFLIEYNANEGNNVTRLSNSISVHILLAFQWSTNVI